jgi:hypothetical protein
MNEAAQGSLAFLAVALTAISAWIWMLGGRSFGELLKWNLNIFGTKSNRVYYRLIAPLFFSISLITISVISGSFNYLICVTLPAYLVISTSGHSKFPRRLVECWCYALPGLLFWTPFLFICQLLLSTVAAVIGHFNQEKKAPVIELIVNFLRIALLGVMCV